MYVILERIDEPMKLFDLLEAPLDKNNPIDRELAKTSKDIEKDGSLDQDDIDSQMDPMGEPENVPDGPMGDTAPVEPEQPIQPVDSALMTRVQNHDYISGYTHDSNKSNHPNMIMSLDMSELSQLRNKIRVNNDRIAIEDKVGMYANPQIKAGQDMLSFVDMVMGFKKSKAVESPTQKSAKAKFNRKTDPKTSAGKTFTPKKSK